MMIAHKRDQDRLNNFQIFMVSAWGFTIVISSLLFLLVGRWVDTKFNTEPLFMAGLLILAVFLCIGRLYWEVRRKGKKC
ncbi:MAG: AtpZ/AtpI family protein [Thermodesulfobacteriota bacterium]|nr:AtpZ/AtpI family protein [Thermodesulfobacteriota bacterium]